MNKWPLQRECDEFYGNPRNGDTYGPKWAAANLVHVACPWALHEVDEKGRLFPIPFITIHRKCADSLTRVLADIAHRCTPDDIKKLKYDVFDGSFNYRPKRSGATLSMHAYGCAIDWDADENPFRSKKHIFNAQSPIVLAFKAEDWTWGGDWDAPDAMHMQAARVR